MNAQTMPVRPGEEHRRLASRRAQIGPLCEGSLSRVFQKCGNPSCRCHRNRKHRHGPYFLWTRKVRGKTVTRKVPPEQVPQCREWIENNRKVNRILRRMRNLALRAAPWNPGAAVLGAAKQAVSGLHRR